MSPSAFAIIAVLAAVAIASDHCNKYMSCPLCVADKYCGWCSTKVIYQNGAPGYQCAGFNSNSSNPFVCNGIYSTTDCRRGYVCNTSTYTCDLSQPGGGMPKAQCEANCSTIGKTYTCNNQTHQCVQAQPGQGTSFEVCEEECKVTHTQSPKPVSPKPASPKPPTPTSPPPTVAPTYLCNTTTFKCDLAGPGKGSSKMVCEQGCHPRNHTPTSLVGLWRAFEIQNGAPIEEIDFDLKDHEAKIYIKGQTTVCTSVVAAGTENVDFESCTGGSATSFKCIYETSPTMPETYHALLACNTDGDAPSSFDSAMTAGGSVFVAFLSKCVPDGFCNFHFGPSQTTSTKSFFEELVDLSVRHKKSKHALKKTRRVASPATDPCQQYGASCAVCIAQQYCGWCSTNVSYNGNVTGSQCAGVNPNPNKHVPFVCNGQYSTEMCLPGYVCNVANQTCVPTTPGDGVPLADCIASCKSKPGPPANVAGKYRGLVINQNYTFGEVTATIGQNGTAVFLLDGAPLFTATIRHQAANIIFDVSTGLKAGLTLIGIFSQTQNELISYMTITMGVVEPANYKAGMVAPNEEYVLAQCASPTCKF